MIGVTAGQLQSRKTPRTQSFALSVPENFPKNRHKTLIHTPNTRSKAPALPRTDNMSHTNGFEQSIPHQQEKNLPGGGNWVVQKFGGTSVGKFAVDIARDIVL